MAGTGFLRMLWRNLTTWIFEFCQTSRVSVLLYFIDILLYIENVNIMLGLFCREAPLKDG